MQIGWLYIEPERYEHSTKDVLHQQALIDVLKLKTKQAHVLLWRFNKNICDGFFYFGCRSKKHKIDEMDNLRHH